MPEAGRGENEARRLAGCGRQRFNIWGEWNTRPFWMIIVAPPGMKIIELDDALA